MSAIDRSANAALKTQTAGCLDLAEIAFLVMMGFGIFRLIRGKFSTPPSERHVCFSAPSEPDASQ